MRRLIIMRHCKSSWSTDSGDDHGRPLNERGRADAPAMGRRLAELNWIPDICVSSDSVRTRQTWQGVSEGLGVAVPVRFARSLYHAGVGQLQPLVAEMRPDVRSLMVLGHNPGFETAVGWFSGVSTAFTTGNAALLESDADDWASAAQAQWTLVDVLRPRDD